jgi:predicted kinase
MLVAGWSVIVDGTFTTVTERDKARALASRSRVPLTTIWCDASDAVLADRLRRRAADPGEVSDAGPELLSGHRARYESPARESETIRVDTTAGPDAAVETALRALSAS